MSATGKERLFLAVALDEEVRHGLRAFLEEELGGEPPPGRVVPPANWHVTLRFLGWGTPEARDRVLGRLHEELAGGAFTVGFGGLGAFPHPRRATVLWLGIDRGAERLGRIAEVAEEAARAGGFPPEERPFHPHLTLSRIRPPRDVTALIGGVRRFPLTLRVREITLFRSRVSRRGAVYEAVATLPLSGEGGEAGT